MTPPVDISALQSIQLGNLDGLSPSDKEQLFKGTGLSYDPKTDKVDLEKSPGQGLTDLDRENEYVHTIREANTNGDKYLDLTEVKTLIDTSLPPEVAAVTDPNQFLKNVEALMNGRYNQLGKNFQAFKGQLAFGPTLDAIRYYNDGLKSEAFRHANAVLPPNGIPTKSLTNIALSPWSLARQVFGKDTGDAHDPKNQALVADKWAMETAENNYNERAAAIAKLSEEIKKGVAANEKWALEANIDEALKKLDPKQQKLLVDELAIKRLHEIMTTQDPKKRYDEMKKFADKERPGFGGFGTGNTSAGWFNTGDLWNISGHRHNTVFARTMYHFLAAKAKTDDADFNKVLREENKLALADSQGDGGGYGNLASIGFTGVGCGLAWFVTSPSLAWRDKSPVEMSTCVTDYRDWGDEEMIDLPGRTLDGALMVAGANGFWNRAGQFRKLRGLMSEDALRTMAAAKGADEKLTFFDSLRAYGSGYRNATPIWWDGVKTWRPVTVPRSGALNPLGQSLNIFGNEAKYAEAIKAAEKLAEGKQTVAGYFGRKFEALLKIGPKLSAEQKAMLAKGTQVGKKGFDFTKALVVIGLAGMADEKLNPVYDPFPIDRQVDFERYPDPTKAPIVGGKK